MRRRLVPLLVPALVAASVAIGPAASAAPAGSVVLAAAATSAFGAAVAPLGADSSGVAYLAEPVYARGLGQGVGTAYFRPTGGAAEVIAAPAALPEGWDSCAQLTGTVLVDGCGVVTAGGTPVVVYRDVDGAGAGSVTLPQSATFVAAGDGGFVYCTSPLVGPASVQLQIPGVATATTLATLTAGELCLGNGASSSAGVVISVFTGSAEGLVDFIPFPTKTTPVGAVTSYPLGAGPVLSVAVTTTGASTAVGWLDAAESGGEVTAVRQTLGVVGRVTTEVSGTASGLVLSAATTAWSQLTATGSVVLASVPAAGGTVSTGSLALNGSGGPGFSAVAGALGSTVGASFNPAVASDGTSFYLGASGAVGAAGLYEASTAAAAPTLLAATAVSPLAGTDVALGPGLAAYGTDATRPLSIYTQGVSVATGLLLTEPATRVARGQLSEQQDAGSGFDLRVSGDRVAYVVGLADGADQLDVTTLTPSAGNASLPGFATAASTKVIATSAGGIDGLWLSGDRLLYDVDAASAGGLVLVLVNLVTGGASVLSALSVDSGFDLWGDYLSYVATNGSVWRDNLVSPARDAQVMPGPVGGAGCTGQSLVAGGYLAWDVVCSSTTDPVDSQLQTQGYRNVSKATAPVLLPNTEILTGLSPTYLAATAVGDSVASGTVTSALVQNLTTGTVTTLGTDPAGSTSISGNRAGWLNSLGQPEVAPLPGGLEAPTYLGQVTAGTQVLPGGKADFVVTAPYSDALSSCTVTISAGAAVVTTLPCAPAQERVGVAQVNWNGKVGGSAVAPGSYTWTVHAAGLGGAALPAVNGGGAVTGSVRVLKAA